MNKSLKYLETSFTVTSIIIFVGAIVMVILSGGQQEYEDVTYDSSLIRIIYFIIYIIIAILLAVRWKNTLVTLRQENLIFPLIFLAIISIFWSADKAVTFKDGITLLGSSLFGLYIASRYSLKQQIELIAWASGIIMLLSFVFVVALPKYGIMGGIHQGKWRGVFTHKNGLGQMMVYSSMVFIFLIYLNKKYRLLMSFCLALSILLLLLSASTTSILNLFILICVFLVCHVFRLQYLLMIPTIVLIVTTGELFQFWFSNNADSVFSLVGKDATLTGRTALWPAVIEMIGKHPWIGYGYGGFWQGLNGAESAYVWRASNWTPSHPHNGFLEILLDLGILGLVVFLIGFSITFIRAIGLVRSSNTVDATWPLIHLVQLVLNSLAESQLLVSNNINWILYIAVAFSLHQNYQIKEIRQLSED